MFAYENIRTYDVSVNGHKTSAFHLSLVNEVCGDEEERDGLTISSSRHTAVAIFRRETHVGRRDRDVR